MASKPSKPHKPSTSKKKQTKQTPPPPPHPPPPQNDPVSIQRGDYTSSPLASTLLFTLGRAITGPIQYYLITRQPLRALFPSLRALPLASSAAPLALTLTLPASLATTLNLNTTLTFARLPLLCAAMPTLLTLKQLTWYHFLMREHMTVPFAFFGATIDLVFESVSSLIFTASLTGATPLWSESLFYAGFTLFTASVALELAAELQRAAFKRDPANKGKLCTLGFWRVVRHVNYTANILHGWAYGLACGGPLYSLATAAMYVANLGSNAAPGMEVYMRQKYEVQWDEYVRETRWKFFPGVW